VPKAGVRTEAALTNQAHSPPELARLWVQVWQWGQGLGCTWRLNIPPWRGSRCLLLLLSGGLPPALQRQKDLLPLLQIWLLLQLLQQQQPLLLQQLIKSPLGLLQPLLSLMEKLLPPLMWRLLGLLLALLQKLLGLHMQLLCMPLMPLMPQLLLNLLAVPCRLLLPLLPLPLLPLPPPRCLLLLLLPLPLSLCCLLPLLVLLPLQVMRRFHPALVLVCCPGLPATLLLLGLLPGLQLALLLGLLLGLGLRLGHLPLHLTLLSTPPIPREWGRQQVHRDLMSVQVSQDALQYRWGRGLRYSCTWEGRRTGGSTGTSRVPR